MMGDRAYYLFDARACGDQGTGEATLLTVSDTAREAEKDAFGMGLCALYEFVENESGVYIEYKWIKDLQ